MDKHTPGPWVASKFGFQVLTGDSWSTVCTLKGGVAWEDQRGFYHQEYEWQNQEANARLIAAAPDMLKALQMILKAAEDGDEMTAISLAEAAVSKAITPHDSPVAPNSSQSIHEEHQ